MLKSIDILVGLSIVMLVVSLAVTVITGAVMRFLQSRGKQLATGIAGLLRQVDSSLDNGSANQIAQAVLKHPLIGTGKLGTVIHREELTTLLLELASGDTPGELEAAARQKLTDLLKKNGITDPKTAFDQLHDVLMRIEKEAPELANDARQAKALAEVAAGAFLAKINARFDQTMDRVSEAFTNHARMVTFVASLVVALGMQLDTAQMITRLNADPELRKQLIQQAVDTKNPNLPQLPAASAPNTAEQAEIQNNLQKFVGLDIVDMPETWDEWTGRWSQKNAPMKLLGILLSALLLSLGAPFWYNALKNLLQLRSVIADKDDAQRAARQSGTDSSS